MVDGMCQQAGVTLVPAKRGAGWSSVATKQILFVWEILPFSTLGQNQKRGLGSVSGPVVYYKFVL